MGGVWTSETLIGEELNPLELPLNPQIKILLKATGGSLAKKRQLEHRRSMTGGSKNAGRRKPDAEAKATSGSSSSRKVYIILQGWLPPPGVFGFRKPE